VAAERGIEMRVDMAGKVSSALTMVAAAASMFRAWVSALMWLQWPWRWHAGEHLRIAAGVARP
jgi:hypothetical protein